MNTALLVVFLLAQVAFIAWCAYDVGFDRGWDAHADDRPHRNQWREDMDAINASLDRIEGRDS